MLSDSEDQHLLNFLKCELQSRDVAALGSPTSWGPSFDWSIRRDEYGFIIDFPAERFQDVASWVAAIFGPPKFDSDAGPAPTKIHRDDTACVTIMLTSNPTATQLILLHWKDTSIQGKICAKRLAAVQQCIQDSVQDMCNAVEQAIDSIGSSDEDEKRKQANAKLDDLRDAANVIISWDKTAKAP